MPDLRVYGRQDGVNNKFYFPLLDPNATDGSYIAGVTIAAGDAKLMKDGGAWTNTNSVFVDEGEGYYSILLNGTNEMDFAVGVIKIVDQTATKEWVDQSIVVHGIAHASALHRGLAGV